jgi:hypothetical protein
MKGNGSENILYEPELSTHQSRADGHSQFVRGGVLGLSCVILRGLAWRFQGKAFIQLAE